MSTFTARIRRPYSQEPRTFRRSASTIAQLTVLGLILAVTASLQGADRGKPPENELGLHVRELNGCPVNYTQEQLGRRLNPHFARVAAAAAKEAPDQGGQGFVPADATTLPFWQYPLFGSGIGASNILIVPGATGGGPREIIIGGNSTSNFGDDDFWQMIRRNPATGNYDSIFASPIYSSSIERIAIGNVVGDEKPELVVMLLDGRIYLYDLGTKTELGHLTTGINGLSGLSLADLDNDGLAEIIVTTVNNLYVFNGNGNLLWQVAGAGGYDVVAGQMDNDPALEIAGTNGMVVDSATHTVQWTRSGGFGSYLRLAPIPGANYQQLIAAQDWSFIYSYDIALQLPRWSLSVFDIDAIEIADVDNDGIPELIIGDGQWGSVHVHDLNTQALKWQVNNPEHGVTNVAVGDVDNDGVVDLLWGAGWTSTGSDYLYVASTTGSHVTKWQSVDLVGPFLGPLIGDLDGDGRPELVACSWESESTYDSGRILVFDLDTLTLRGMSAPIVNNYAWTGTHDLKLCDLEGDGRKEIVVAADYLYDGAIEIYGFNASNQFNLKWANTMRPSGSPFNFVDVVDLDGNGVPEVIAGNYGATTGSAGNYVYIFDYPATANPWHSVNLTSAYNGVTGLVVGDIEGNGRKKFAALVSGGDLYTFDGPTRQLESWVQQSGGILLSRRSPSGLIKSDNSGVGHFLSYSNHTYTENFSRPLGSPPLSGVTVLDDATLWTGASNAITLRIPPSYDAVTWQSPAFGTGFGRFVATDIHNGQSRVFSSARHAIAGFEFVGPTPTPAPTATPVPSLPITISLPVASIDITTTNFTQPVMASQIDPSSNLIGFQGDFTFDSTVVSFQAAPVSAVGLTGNNWNVSANVLSGSGPIRTLRISAFTNDGITPLSGSGALFNLNLTRVSNVPGASTALTWAALPNDFEFIDSDLNIQWPESTPPGTITIVAGTVSISGNTQYCPNPDLDPVPNILFTLSGSVSGSATSDDAGHYTFSSLVSGGNYTVTPSSSPFAPGTEGKILNTFDAMAVYFHYLGIEPLPSGCPQQAADVDGNGVINTYDAVAIQRFFVGRTFATGNVGQFTFNPASRSYSGITVDQKGQDYSLLVYGDVAAPFLGDNGGSTRAAGGDEARAVAAEVILPNINADSVKRNFSVTATVSTIDVASNLMGFQGDFTFDERVITFEEEPIGKAGVTNGNWSVIGNVLEGAGPIRTLRVSGFSMDFKPLSGSGQLFEVRVKRVNAAAASARLTWAASDNFVFIDANLRAQRPGNVVSGSIATKTKLE